MMHGVYAVLSTGSNAMSGRRSSVMMPLIRQSLVPEVSGWDTQMGSHRPKEVPRVSSAKAVPVVVTASVAVEPSAVAEVPFAMVPSAVVVAAVKPKRGRQRSCGVRRWWPLGQ